MLDSNQTNKIITDWYTAMGHFDMGGIFGPLDEKVEFVIGSDKYRPVIPYLGTWHGRDAFGEGSKARNETSQITGFELRDVVAQGNRAAAWIYSKSTCIATGKECELEIVQWIDLNDEGKITKVTAIFDPIPELEAFTPDKFLDWFTK